MFSQLEHEALMRLMTHATGHTPDSQRIAHWLQEWEHADVLRTPQLAASHAADVVTVAEAARRDGTKPTALGRDEYAYNMRNIARSYPLPSAGLER